MLNKYRVSFAFDTISNLVKLTLYSVNKEHNHSFYR